MTDLHDDIARRLRGARQRYTPARRQLVEVLSDGGGPRTIPELLDRAAAGSQSSLYRNLAVLEQADVVRRLQGAGDVSRFELAEDVTGHHHHHLVCLSCGAIDDFELPADAEQALDDAVAAAVTDAGFATDHHRFDLLGTCHRCA